MCADSADTTLNAFFGNLAPTTISPGILHDFAEWVFSPSPAVSFLFQARIRKFGPKILQLLAEWTETFPYDFQEEQMIGHLKDMIHRIAPCDEVRLVVFRGAGECSAQPFSFFPTMFCTMGPHPIAEGFCE